MTESHRCVFALLIGAAAAAAALAVVFGLAT